MNMIAERFLNAIGSGKAVHGYLIVSTDLERAFELARLGASILLLQRKDPSALKLNPNYFELDGSAKIDELRAVRSELYKQTYSGKNRVITIKNIHLMNDNAINAMLKMLEEPPHDTYFLLTGLELRILPTIRSRCHIVRVGIDNPSEIASRLKEQGASPADSHLYAQLAFNNEKQALRLYAEPEYREIRKSALQALIDMMDGKTPFKWAKALGKERELAIDSIGFMLSACHDMIFLKCGIGADINVDYSREISKRIEDFTFSEIGVIIDALVDTSMKLTTNAGVNPTLDGLIVRLTNNPAFHQTKKG